MEIDICLNFIGSKAWKEKKKKKKKKNPKSTLTYMNCQINENCLIERIEFV